MADTAVLIPRQNGPAESISRRITPPRAMAASAALVGLGAMHFALDGLSGVLVTLQPFLVSRTGARPAMLGLVVATALATASLLQPVAARLAARFGEQRMVAIGAGLAAVGYGIVPAVRSVPEAV